MLKNTTGMHTSYQIPQSGRTLLNINDNWRFIRGDGEAFHRLKLNDQNWDVVDVPHTWNIEDAFTGSGCHMRGPFWYRRYVTIDKDYNGKQFYLQFDGVNRECEVYVNGKLVGSHVGGYSIFRFDITFHVKPGEEHIIAVRVTNRYSEDLTPIFSDSTSFGGILKDVYLLITDKLHVDVLDYGSSGVYLTQRSVNAASAELEATIRVMNDDTVDREAVVNLVIVDADGRIVQTDAEQVKIPAGELLVSYKRLVVKSPRLWHGRQDPYLYQVYAEIKYGEDCADIIQQPLGLRHFHIDCDEGFYLNGEPYNLHGVSRSYDRAGKGRAISYEDQIEDMDLILEMGCTAIRAPLYDSAQMFYDLCDQHGILLSAEIPVTNRVGLSDTYYQTTESQLIELIRQNYNHPCVVTWGIANEIVNEDHMNEADAPDPADVLTRLNTVAHEEDPVRYTNICANRETNTSSNWIADSTTWNMYNGWYLGEHSGSMESVAERIDGVRRDNPGKLLGMSEFGPGASIHYHSATPVCMDHTEEYQCLFHETYWKIFESRKYLWVKYAWLLCDFSCHARNEGDTPGINDKGMVTFDRKVKKDVFYWYKANWSSEPFVYITGRRFNPRPLDVNSFKLYSNCDRVELKVNGVSLGFHESKDKRFVWDGVPLVDGNNTLEAIGIRNGHRYYDRCVILAHHIEVEATKEA